MRKPMRKLDAGPVDRSLDTEPVFFTLLGGKAPDVFLRTRKHQQAETKTSTRKNICIYTCTLYECV